MPRGGRRAGRAGAKYPNRSDLAMAPRTAPSVQITGQAYGAATDQAAMQQTVTAAQRATAPPQPDPAAAQRRAPLPPVDLDGPSQFPSQPVTAGLAIGPGAGPEVLGMNELATLQKLKRMYRSNPNPDLLQLILLAEEG